MRVLVCGRERHIAPPSLGLQARPSVCTPKLMQPSTTPMPPPPLLVSLFTFPPEQQRLLYHCAVLTFTSQTTTASPRLPPHTRRAVFWFSGKGPGVNQACLKSVLSSAFQQRRKMLRQSLKPLLRAGQMLPEEFATRRPEQVVGGREALLFLRMCKFI